VFFARQFSRKIIGNTLPSTAILASFAIVIAIVFGILFGIISALHKDTWIDRLIALVSTLGMSIPF
jgi:peptide/nickel transport system permease protein